ncbi:MAG: hypothetical protein GX410_06590 [Elusimicrobia bacterium]|nr:hypothetical protein [Elusimicrobiota bacterium]
MNKKTALHLLLSALLFSAAAAQAQEQSSDAKGIKTTVYTIDSDGEQIVQPALTQHPISSQLSRGVPMDSNIPEEVKNQMGEDMNFISTLQGSGATKFHSKIFGQVDGKTYMNYFTSRVKSIGLNSCGGPNSMAVACVIPFMDSSKMWITKNYMNFNHPQIARLMVVFHEARHTESGNGNWPHATCPTPYTIDGHEVNSIWTGSSLAGEPACDSTPFGAYGSSVVMLKNIEKFCSNCTGKVQADAGIYADDQFKRIIDPKARQEMTADLYQ